MFSSLRIYFLNDDLIVLYCTRSTFLPRDSSKSSFKPTKSNKLSFCEPNSTKISISLSAFCWLRAYEPNKPAFFYSICSKNGFCLIGNILNVHCYLVYQIFIVSKYCLNALEINKLSSNFGI